MNASIEDIEQAIWYLIRIAQLDNYDIQQKIFVAKYIDNREIIDVAKSIHSRLSKKRFDMDSVFAGSYIEVRPKMVQLDFAGGSSAANTPLVLSRISDYMYYFRLSVEAQIFDILWIMKFGTNIDELFTDSVYANRLSLDGEYLFKHYWGQYQKWRDEGFSDKLLTGSKSNKSIISFDISKFYNSIRVKNLRVKGKSIFPKLLWNKYDELISKYNEELIGTLPIGPFSSGIFSNQILYEFDEQIKSKKNVLFYGRYVDDILIVCEREGDLSVDLNEFAEQNETGFKIVSSGNEFEFNKEKTRVYDYDNKHSLNAFDVFKRLIDEYSSEWKLAPDQEMSEYQFTKAISSFNPTLSINKPRSFSEVKISQKELKAQLTKYVIEFSAIDIFLKHERNEIERSLNFAFSGGNAIKYFELWPSLFTVFKLLNNEDAICKIIKVIVNNLIGLQTDNTTKDCRKYLFRQVAASYIIASANCSDKVNRATFAKIKEMLNDVLIRGISERNVRQLLWLSLQRGLLFNREKCFQDCVKEYNIEVTELDPIDISLKNHSEILLKEFNDFDFEIGKYSKVRVALAHVKVDEKRIDESIRGIRKASVIDFKRVIRPINDAISSGAHLLCYPEVSVPERLLGLLLKYATLKRISIIAGIEHCEYNGKIGNFIVFAQPTEKGVKVFARPKIHYAPAEIAKLVKFKVKDVWTSSKLPIYRYRNTALSIFNCFELADIKMRGLVKGKVDIVIGLEYNFDLHYFSNIMESMCRDNHVYCIQSNAGQIGENRIIAPIEKHHANIIRFKAGLDPMAITDTLNISKLREYHDTEDVYYNTKNKIEFRKLPPGFKVDK